MAPPAGTGLVVTPAMVVTLPDWPRLIPGVCRWCGCTEGDACPDLAYPDDDPADPDELPACGWAVPGETLCTVCARLGGPPPGFPRTERGWRDAVDEAALHVAVSDPDEELEAAGARARLMETLRHLFLLRRGRALGFDPAPPRPSRPPQSLTLLN